MYLGCKMKIPKDGVNITVKTINGTTYIYIEKGLTYSREKKYNEPKGTCIGKRVPELLVYSTREAHPLRLISPPVTVI